MLKAVTAVLAGFVLMSLLVFGALAGAYELLGPDRAYQPGVYEVTTLWVGITLVVGVVAALAGGYLCRVIAGRPLPVIVLAALVLALGGLSATFEMIERNDPAVQETNIAPPPEPRPADVAMFDAMVKSKPPIWLMWANAGIGFVGVLIGGGRKQKAKAKGAES